MNIAGQSSNMPMDERDAEKVSPDSGTSNQEGTFHQSQLGPKAKRHFFSPLDLSYADAVHKDAETVNYSEDEEVCSV